MASLIASGTAEATSGDFTLVAGNATTLSLSGAAQPFGTASIQIKSAAATYTPIGTLNSAAPILVLSAVGTFRVVKSGSSVAFGVERD